MSDPVRAALVAAAEATGEEARQASTEYSRGFADGMKHALAIYEEKAAEVKAARRRDPLRKK